MVRQQAEWVWEGSSLAVRVQESGQFLPGEQFRVLGNSPTQQQLQLYMNLMKTHPLPSLFLFHLNRFVSLSHQTARAWISAHLYSHHFGGFNWIKWLPDQEITVIHSLCQLSMELDESVCSRKRDMQCMEGCRRLLRNSTSDLWFFSLNFSPLLYECEYYHCVVWCSRFPTSCCQKWEVMCGGSKQLIWGLRRISLTLWPPQI